MCVHVLNLSVVSDSCNPIDIACQAPLSMGFSRHEYWSGLPFPSPGDLPHPGIKSRSHVLQADSLLTTRESEVAQLCPTLSDPMDCSPPGSSVHGIFQARVLEWGAIAFSSDYKGSPPIYMVLHKFTRYDLAGNWLAPKELT